MLYTYKEAIDLFENQYRLEKAINDGELFKIEEGIYSTNSNETQLAIISKKYPKAILSGYNAFYHHHLTDMIPEKYDLATLSKAAKINDERIHQIYVRDDLFMLGAVEEEFEGTKIKIYDKERMLIELLRNKNSMPHDIYKEILLQYRELIYDLQIWRIQEYAAIFPKSKMIQKALDEEVL